MSSNAVASIIAPIGSEKIGDGQSPADAAHAQFLEETATLAAGNAIEPTSETQATAAQVATFSMPPRSSLTRACQS